MPEVKPKLARIEVWTDRDRILGTLYIPAGEGYKGRISDMLNDDRTFLPLTNVTVFPLEGENPRRRTDFLALNKASIVLVQALEE